MNKSEIRKRVVEFVHANWGKYDLFYQQSIIEDVMEVVERYEPTKMIKAKA